MQDLLDENRNSHDWLIGRFCRSRVYNSLWQNTLSAMLTVHNMDRDFSHLSRETFSPHEAFSIVFRTTCPRMGVFFSAFPPVVFVSPLFFIVRPRFGRFLYFRRCKTWHFKLRRRRVMELDIGKYSVSNKFIWKWSFGQNAWWIVLIFGCCSNIDFGSYCLSGIIFTFIISIWRRLSHVQNRGFSNETGEIFRNIFQLII